MLAVLTLIIECLLLAGLNTSQGATMSDTAVIILIIVFTCAYIFTVDKSKRLQNIKFPLLLGYVFRLCLSFWDIYGRAIYVLPNSGADSERYYQTAVSYAQGQEITYGVPFTALMGGIFSWTGISRLWGQFLIMLFSIVTIHAAGMILDKIMLDERIKRKSMYILCLLPNFAILSSIFLRESIITMCMAISLYCFFIWYVRKNELFFAAAFAFVFCGASFHAGVVGFAVGYIVVRVLYDEKQQQMKISAKGMIFAMLFLFVFVFLYNNYSDTLFGKVGNVESISDIAKKNDAGGSDYSRYVGNSNNPINLIIYTPLRILFFLFSPFPWQWRNLSDIIAFFGSSMFYMWAVICAIRYLKNSDNNKRKQLIIVLLTLVFCSVFVFAWGVSNTGTAIRHRDKMVVLYLVLYAVATRQRTHNSSGLRQMKLLENEIN